MFIPPGDSSSQGTASSHLLPLLNLIWLIVSHHSSLSRSLELLAHSFCLWVTFSSFVTSEWPRARLPCFIWVGDAGKPWEASWACVPPGCRGPAPQSPLGPRICFSMTHTPCHAFPPRTLRACVSHPLGFSFSSSYCCCDLLSVDSWLYLGGPHPCLACRKTSLQLGHRGRGCPEDHMFSLGSWAHPALWE